MHTRRWVALVTIASFLGGPLAAGAADRDRDPPSPPVAVGDRVRIFLRDALDGSVIGEVVEVDQRGVVVRLKDHRVRSMDWQSVSSVWISLGRRSDTKGGAVNGAVAGGLALGLAGAFLVPCVGDGAGSECLTTHGAGPRRRCPSASHLDAAASEPRWPCSSEQRGGDAAPPGSS